jgi:3-methyladenine DNA glycosylase AlkD
MSSTAEQVREALLSQGDPEKAAFFPTFFKTGPGEYGEGDKFIGVTVPDQRKIAKQFRGLELDQIQLLLHDEFHECRLTALFVLTELYQKAKTVEQKTAINEFYLAHLDRVNNWDLVDATAHKILGAELVRTGDTVILGELSKSKHLWRERVSIISTLALIKMKEFGPTLQLCRHFLNHEHDLIHKATGWMLREIGKIKKDTLELFLARHSKKMPRTMLRYAIEKFPKGERELWLEKSRT